MEDGVPSALRTGVCAQAENPFDKVGGQYRISPNGAKERRGGVSFAPLGLEPRGLFGHRGLTPPASLFAPLRGDSIELTK